MNRFCLLERAGLEQKGKNVVSVGSEWSLEV
jgi:hypothetical protein